MLKCCKSGCVRCLEKIPYEESLIKREVNGICVEDFVEQLDKSGELKQYVADLIIKYEQIRADNLALSKELGDTKRELDKWVNYRV